MRCFIFIICISFFISCQPSLESRYEYQLMECRFNSYDITAEEFILMHKSFELDLIRLGLLKSNDASSYKELLIKISQNDYPKDFYYTDLNLPAYNTLILNDAAFKECSRLLDEKIPEIKKQKLIRYREEIIMDLTVNTNDEIATSMLSLLDDQDYELLLYQLSITLLILNMEEDIGIIDDSRKPLMPPEYVVEFDGLKVFLNEDDTIELNGVVTTLNQVASVTLKFIKSNNGDICINLANNRQAKYATYLALVNQLEQAINSYRNNIAIARFNKLYDKLTEKQQKEIKIDSPIKIKET